MNYIEINQNFNLFEKHKRIISNVDYLEDLDKRISIIDVIIWFLLIKFLSHLIYKSNAKIACKNWYSSIYEDKNFAKFNE